jgi:hypothetical protein
VAGDDFQRQANLLGQHLRDGLLSHRAAELRGRGSLGDGRPFVEMPLTLPSAPPGGEGRESKDERSSECEWQMNCYILLFA